MCQFYAVPASDPPLAIPAKSNCSVVCPFTMSLKVGLPHQKTCNCSESPEAVLSAAVSTIVTPVSVVTPVFVGEAINIPSTGR